jgi:MarR family transcriptional regulator, transcriptional regulator for hemolysin
MPFKKEASEQPIGRMLSIIAKSYLQTLIMNLSDIDIDRNYYALLLIETAEGNITQRELASLLEIDKVTMLRSIDYLSEKGYVERVNNATDRRKYSLVLTDKGRKALPRIKKAFSDVNNIALKGLTKNQVSELNTILLNIKKNLNEYPSNS